jgi:hypothetical protein
VGQLKCLPPLNPSGIDRRQSPTPNAIEVAFRDLVWLMIGDFTVAEQNGTCKTFLETCKTAPMAEEFSINKLLNFRSNFGAGEGNRTLDTQLGKLVFCH